MNDRHITLWKKDVYSGEVTKEAILESKLGISIEEVDDVLYAIVRHDDITVIPKEVWEIWDSITDLGAGDQLSNDLKLFCERNAKFCEKLNGVYSSIDDKLLEESRSPGFQYERYINGTIDIVSKAQDKSKTLLIVITMISQTPWAGEDHNVVTELLHAEHEYMTASIECFSVLGTQLLSLRDQSSGERKTGFFAYRKIVNAKRSTLDAAKLAGERLNVAYGRFYKLVS